MQPTDLIRTVCVEVQLFEQAGKGRNGNTQVTYLSCDLVAQTNWNGEQLQGTVQASEQLFFFFDPLILYKSSQHTIWNDINKKYPVLAIINSEQVPSVDNTPKNGVFFINNKCQPLLLDHRYSANVFSRSAVCCSSLYLLWTGISKHAYSNEWVLKLL